ncbi:MAG TPA: DHA2 family efflux MFS transporter permease subunit [Pseudonocardia sp.]
MTDRWVLPLIVLTIGQFMAVLDMTIVNIAMPTLANEFGVAIDKIEWVVTAYSLTLGVVAPASGWLSDRIGPTRLFTMSLVGFALASTLCGLAWDLTSMVVFRILQAIPGGIIPMITMLIIYRIVPPEKLGTAMGMFGIGIMVGPALGPTLGGYLVQHATWQLIFFINVPVGLIGAVVCLARLPKLLGHADRTFDGLGFVTAAGGLFIGLLVLHEGKEWGWTSYTTMIWGTVSVLLLALFVVIQLEKDEPLINLRVLKTFPYTVSLLLILFIAVGMQSVYFFLTIFMQQVRGLQAFDAGLMMLPQTAAMMVLMPLSGPIQSRFGSRGPVVVGLAIMGYASWLLSGITPDTTNHQLMMWTTIRAVGTGLAMMPIITAGMNAIPVRYATAGSQLNSITQELAGSLGLAAMGVLADRLQAQLTADWGAMIPHTTPTKGFNDLYGRYQQLASAAAADAYGSVYLIAGSMVLLAIPLAFLLAAKPKNEPAQPGPVPAEPVLAGASRLPPEPERAAEPVTTASTAR